MRLAFSTLGCPVWTVEDAVDAAVDHGYDGIEWRCADGGLLGSGTDEDVYSRIARASREAGIAVACLDTSCAFVQQGVGRHDAVVAECAAMVAHAERIGSPAVRVFAGRMGDAERADLVAPAVDALVRATADAREHGVRLLVETHDDWSRARDVRLLLDEVDDLGVCWDVVHTHRAGEAPVRTLEALGDRIGLVHVKDTRGDDLVACGEGDVPLAGIAELLRNSGYDGFVSFEWEKLWHQSLAEPDDALPAAARYLAPLFV